MKGGGDIYDCLIHTLKNQYPTKALRPVRRDDTEGFFYSKNKNKFKEEIYYGIL